LGLPLVKRDNLAVALQLFKIVEHVVLLSRRRNELHEEEDRCCKQQPRQTFSSGASHPPQCNLVEKKFHASTPDVLLFSSLCPDIGRAKKITERAASGVLVQTGSICQSSGVIARSFCLLLQEG
jgi:hypothetical protein